MRSKVIAVVFLLIMAVMVFTIIGINKWEGSEPEEKNTGVTLEATTTTLRSEVMKDIITYSISVKGNADSFMDKSYYEIIEIPFANKMEKDSFKCNYVAGSEIKAEEVLYSINGKNNVIKYDARVVDMEKSEEGALITVINYEKVYVRCLVKYQDIDIFKVGDKLELKIDYGNEQSEAFEGVIAGSGSVVEDNLVDIYIKTDKKLLPGVNVSGKYSYEKNVEAMYVLKDMVMSDGVDEYVYLVDEQEERVKVIVERGEEFTVQTGDVATEFVEIFGELNEGDKLIVDILVE